MNVQAQINPWSEDALFAKAILYASRMEIHTHSEDGQFGFWSALCLEFVARAALAHVSPVLLADDSNWRNITYALGHKPTAKRFTASSISTREALARLSELVPEFNEELVNFGSKHLDRRNSELHTGELPFVDLRTSEWLAKFYSACKVLVAFVGKDLSSLFSDPQGAQAMIDAFEDKTARAVDQDVKAYAQVWRNKSLHEKTTLTDQAMIWATRQSGHRVRCPACESSALVYGTPRGAVSTSMCDDEVEQKQTMIPSAFECVACGLKIMGLSKLNACGIGDVFIAKTTYSPAEFFGLYTDNDLDEARREAEARYEEDFNEP